MSESALGSSSGTISDAASAAATGGPLGPKGLAWASFEWARNPYYNVVVISIFAPFFAAQVVDNGAQGQALVARTILIAGLIMAVLSPILGAVADQGGQKKPILAAVLATIAACALGLWFVAPSAVGAIPLGMGLMVTAYCCYTVSELFHNAMLKDAGAPKSLPIISGLGIGLGNLGGVVALLVVLWISQTHPFGISSEAVPRAAAVLVGVWLLVFIAPFFLFMPDSRPENASWAGAFKGLMGTEQTGGASFLSRTKTYVRDKFRDHPNVMRFLLARMIYADGVAALLTLGTTYVASENVLNWSTGEVAIFGIMAAIFAAIGGFGGGVLDRAAGPKRALYIELSTIFVLLIFQLSVTAESALFGLIPADQPLHEGTMFATLADLIYLITVIPLGVAIGASITTSRYMLVHIAPPEKLGEFFGFFAMAGSITVWLGPGIVDLMTSLSGDERVGMAGILVLFVGGMLLLATVKADKTPEHEKPPEP